MTQAVADNALSNDMSTDPHPLSIGVFPYAHRGARQFVVLHSQNDGILGGDFDLSGWLIRYGHYGSKYLVPPIGFGGIPGYEDSSEEAIKDAGGAYPKKWWDVAYGGLGSPLNDYYSDYFPLVTYSDRYTKDERMQLYLHPTNWYALRDALVEEMERFVHHDLDGADTVPDYDLLEPVAIRRVLRRHHVEDYVHDLRQLVLDFYATDSSPRPALGYVGFDLIRHEDEFIDDALESGKFAWVDQKDWLFTHSGMRVPSEELFENVYEREIARRLKEDSAFGRY